MRDYDVFVCDDACGGGEGQQQQRNEKCIITVI